MSTPLCNQYPAAANTIALAVLQAGAQLGFDHVLLSVRYDIAEKALEALVGEAS